jgi:rubredoxin
MSTSKITCPNCHSKAIELCNGRSGYLMCNVCGLEFVDPKPKETQDKSVENDKKTINQKNKRGR